MNDRENVAGGADYFWKNTLRKQYSRTRTLTPRNQNKVKRTPEQKPPLANVENTYRLREGRWLAICELQSCVISSKDFNICDPLQGTADIVSLNQWERAISMDLRLARYRIIQMLGPCEPLYPQYQHAYSTQRSPYISHDTIWENLFQHQDITTLVILTNNMFDQVL